LEIVIYHRVIFMEPDFEMFYTENYQF